jgi:hypothetical protein
MTKSPLPDTDADEVLRQTLQPLVQVVGAHPSPQPGKISPTPAVEVPATTTAQSVIRAAESLQPGSTTAMPASAAVAPGRSPLRLGPARLSPARRERAFTVEVPPELRRAVRLRAAEDGITERVLVLRALRAYGLPVAEGDLVDRRQFNGARRHEP